MERIYKPLKDLSDIEINWILESGSIDELILLPLSVGEYHQNWKYAQDLCIKLSGHEDVRVRASAILGLAYIARTKGKLEKHLVKPVLLKELNDNKEYQWRVIDAINDINIFLEWDIGKKALAKIKE